jgi:hypothetical protein
MYGVVCIPVRPDFEEFCLDSLAYSETAFLERLFSFYEFQQDDLFRGRFDISNSLLVGRFICLEVEGIGWSYFSKHVVKRNTEFVLYASMYSSYGERIFYARTSDSEPFIFSFDDDSDEECQDDFDELEYEKKLHEGESRWLKLIDNDLVLGCTPLTKYIRSNNFEDNDFNWDIYVEQRHGSLLAKLQTDVKEMVRLLSSSDITDVAFFIGETLSIDPLGSEALSIAKGLMGSSEHNEILISLKDVSLSKPDSFLGEWRYKYSDKNGKKGNDLTFKFDSDLDKFIFESKKNRRNDNN